MKVHVYTQSVDGKRTGYTVIQGAITERSEGILTVYAPGKVPLAYINLGNTTVVEIDHELTPDVTQS